MLMPEPKQNEMAVEKTTPTSGPTPARSDVRSFCKTPTASDTSPHGGFSVLRRHVDECLPPLDMTQSPPTQELVAKDLHGMDWWFRHIFRGQISFRVVGVCLSVRKGLLLGMHSFSSEERMVSSVLIVCLLCTTNLDPSEFIIPYDQYMESVKNNYAIGVRFRMRFEGEEALEQRFTGTIVGSENLDPLWPESSWRSLKVRWDELSNILRPDKVSPWKIEPASSPPVNPLPLSKVLLLRLILILLKHNEVKTTWSCKNFDEAPNRLISFKNQFQDQGSAHHFSEPYFFIPPQPSLTVEASTQMHTECKDLLFQNGHNTMYGENNPDHFFVATQDADIRAKLREVPRVPVIYGLKNSLFIEQPSMQQRKFTQLDEEKRLHMGWFRLHRFVDPSVRVAIELPCTTAKIPRVVLLDLPSALGYVTVNHVPYMFDLTSRCTLTKVIDWYERAKEWNKVVCYISTIFVKMLWV
ncbi:hypothetical protein GUJ93_ZPchr0013g37620 [Zizania palustris]|uniref:Auxin response factor domain-containing protein n=1 Tax=Zizania palustris TaxID=103762 RepID=A0A8J5WYX5_ZIZPA|nr:hypothetical protein GUJ93_ZPchr0013g37620 [Zizania palustris]